jgi:hypothetical protein
MASRDAQQHTTAVQVGKYRLCYFLLSFLLQFCVLNSKPNPRRLPLQLFESGPSVKKIDQYPGSQTCQSLMF